MKKKHGVFGDPNTSNLKNTGKGIKSNPFRNVDGDGRVLTKKPAKSGSEKPTRDCVI